MTKFSEIEENEYQNYYVEILVQSDYFDKDDLKDLGAKWDPNYKQWYFRYRLDSFINKESINTNKFMPDYVRIVEYNSTKKKFIDIQMSSNDRANFVEETLKRWKNFITKK
mmetsp:Transcript_21554/g.22296  ORF Transcript_21554/g.22296 Transcript_21554/m.22296 type:complete len:111 (+) Transcript_21554:65-397(+)